MITAIETAAPVADDFEGIVSLHYETLYRFAFSLAGTEADARDLTQQTFYIWAGKGHQLRDRSKVKSWLFTTLHREFLQSRRRASRFPRVELSAADEDLPVVSADVVNTLDAARVIELLAQVQEPYRVALSLFYLEDYSYKEIASILEIPLGTVRSRISRGVAQLQQFIHASKRRAPHWAPSAADSIEPYGSTVAERSGPDRTGSRHCSVKQRLAWLRPPVWMLTKVRKCY